MCNLNTKAGIEHAQLDLLVEGVVVVELKSVERLHPVIRPGHHYLKLTGCPAGLLLNFNERARAA